MTVFTEEKLESHSNKLTQFWLKIIEWKGQTGMEKSKVFFKHTKVMNRQTAGHNQWIKQGINDWDAKLFMYKLM